MTGDLVAADVVGEPAVPGGGERWGWELRRDRDVVFTPFEQPPPGLALVGDARWLARLTARRDGLRQRRATSVKGVVLSTGFAVASWSLADAVGGPVTTTVALGFTAAALGFGYAVTGPGLARVEAAIRYRRWRTRVLQAHLRVEPILAAWAAARAAHDNSDQVEATVGAVAPETRQRVDVFGGTPHGWIALLNQAVGSMLADGTRVHVVDVSQHGIATTLTGDAHTVLVPEHLGDAGWLDQVPHTDLASALAEAIAAAGTDQQHQAVNVGVDTSILTRLLAALTGPVTVTRLAAAVEVVAGAREQPDCLDREEYRGLLDAFTQADRAQIRSRLYQISAAVQALATTGSPVESAYDPAAGDNPLVLWQLSEIVSDYAGTLLAHLMTQFLLLGLRTDTSVHGPRAVVLIGADRLSRRAVERLDLLARRRSVRLVLLFAHLRDDSVQVLGGGDAVLLMRLANAKEAEHAANFIGREHRLVASGWTASRTTSTSSTTGESTSQADGESATRGTSTNKGRSSNFTVDHGIALPHTSGSRSSGQGTSLSTATSSTHTTGSSVSEQSGLSQSEQVTYSRVHEYTVNPTLLQGLSPTAFILVDPADPRSPRLADAALPPPERSE